MDGSDLHARMKEAVGSRSYRAIADLTATHAETVRRYLQGQSPSVEFLGALCIALDISAHWMITGQGPKLRSEARAHALREASMADLLAAVAAAFDSLADRTGRIERETHQTGASSDPPHPHASDATVTDPTPHAAQSDTAERARRIAGGIAKRQRPDAG